jgi:hypothetical protein
MYLLYFRLLPIRYKELTTRLYCLDQLLLRRRQQLRLVVLLGPRPFMILHHNMKTRDDSPLLPAMRQ